MSLNKSLFRNYVKDHIKECIEGEKEKAKIPFISMQKIQEAKKIIKDMNYYIISVHWREIHTDYVIVIYDI
ncbi:hypothetical protein [Staphylococcus equorum]|uniref:hypothetical protein n=1 Tax=Staphylococcus equorum TaxID=246432 RepID=UPI000852C49B|nr:hypothetical protein [Staphylococcus equorum]OEK60637.1 hypothetical protein ASS99_11280 [Staphylococcus equorum]